jgi:hypothetical protein
MAQQSRWLGSLSKRTPSSPTGPARQPPGLGPIRVRAAHALLTLELETMADLIRGGLATVRVEVVMDRGSKIETAHVRITDAGGHAAAGQMDINMTVRGCA